MGNGAQGHVVDLWAPVSFDVLPPSLIAAASRSDWEAVRSELRIVMDAVTTDGAYGRALLQFVMQTPLPSDPTVERYKASICIDHGDWDGLQRHLAANPVEAAELIGVRDIILAPIDRSEPPPAVAEHQRRLFEIHEWEFQRAVRRYKQWAQRMLGFYPDVIWSRNDIPVGRHIRFRRLQDLVWLAVGEAHGGVLAVAEACANEAQRLGDEGEPGRDLAYDLEALVGHARGGRLDRELRFRDRVASPIGLSPLGSWETLFHLVPFFTYLDDGSVEWCARVGQQVATRLGSPRAHLQARSWHVAAGMLGGFDSDEVGLPGLLAETRRAAPGLRVLPVLLRGIATKRSDDLRLAEQIARRVGNVWAQVSALTWLVGLAPDKTSCSWLDRLLTASGWRRPLLVPSALATQAARNMTLAGHRGVAIVELAGAGQGTANAVEVAITHLQDAQAPKDSRLAAIRLISQRGTAEAREVVSRVALRSDDLGAAARRGLAGRPDRSELTEREVEVLELAGRGLTNREIADRLVVSQHTVARHLANARTKLGAANRTEAAVMLEERADANPRGS